MVHASQVATATTSLTTVTVHQVTKNRPTPAKTIVFRTGAALISLARPIRTACLAKSATIISTTTVFATLAFRRVARNVFLFKELESRGLSFRIYS